MNSNKIKRVYEWLYLRELLMVNSPGREALFGTCALRERWHWLTTRCLDGRIDVHWHHDSCHLRYVIQDLERVRHFDAKIHAALADRFLATTRQDQYKGLRIELLFAAHLLSRGVKVEMPDPPDI